ncbi:MAG: hypothetical protein WEA10_03270 [Actinomycetota bacterium]
MTDTTETEHQDEVEFVHVFDTPSQGEGEIAKNRLEAEGIPVIEKEFGGMLPAGTVQLWVPSTREAEARALFEDLGVGDLEVDED